MPDKTRRRFRFSLSNLVLLTTVVALTIVATRGVWKSQRMQNELRVATQKVQKVEATSSAFRRRVESEFFGQHGEPVLAINLRTRNSKPWLIRILNSKHAGQGGVFRLGSKGKSESFYHPLASGNSPSAAASEMVQVDVDLRLLRTLDGIDYYRLKYATSAPAPDGAVDNSQKVLLFEYDGNSRLLVSDETLVLAISPDRESCIETVVSTYSKPEADELRLAWQSGPNQARVRTMFRPSVRTVVDRPTKD